MYVCMYVCMHVCMYALLHGQRGLVEVVDEGGEGMLVCGMVGCCCEQAVCVQEGVLCCADHAAHPSNPAHEGRLVTAHQPRNRPTAQTHNNQQCDWSKTRRVESFVNG